jgi:hypothetical protein
VAPVTVAVTVDVATGAVASTTGRSATAVEVAKIHAEMSAARAVKRAPQQTRRGPRGPVW